MPELGRRTAACSLVGLLGLAVLAAAPAATAAPVDDARAEATRIEAELERQGEQISRLDEQYNRARIRAQQAETELGRERQGLADAEARLGAARQLMTRQALIAYVHGGNASVVDQLVRTDSRDLLVRPHYAGTVLADERRAVRELHDARRALDDQRHQQEATTRDLDAAALQLAQLRDQAAAAIAAQEATLEQVQGRIAQLVAADAARQAADAARQARARATPPPPAPRRAAAPTTSTTAPPRPSAPGTHPAPVPAPAPVIVPPAAVGPGLPATAKGAVAVRTAQSALGKPYEWAADGPDSFDCSGLTMWAWAAAGVQLPHSSELQQDVTTPVTFDQLRPGDLVFFGVPAFHVGIYAGNGQMIEAPHTGAFVRYRSIWRSDLSGFGHIA